MWIVVKSLMLKRNLCGLVIVVVFCFFDYVFGVFNCI